MLSKIVPDASFKLIDKRFTKPKKSKLKQGETASFDLLRAAVNLVVSSALIAYGTSQKLPLSTTFVTFMVAMGTSFADRAWGLESAVYRIAGVLNVIGGWFLTALVAFLGSALVATFLYFTSWYGVLILGLVTAYLLISSHLGFSKREKDKGNTADTALLEKEFVTHSDLLADSRSLTSKNLKSNRKLLEQCLELLQKGKAKGIEQGSKELRKLETDHKKLLGKLFKYIRKSNPGETHMSKFYLHVVDLTQDILQSTLLISDLILEHKDNHHPMPDAQFVKSIQMIDKNFMAYLQRIEKEIESTSETDPKLLQQEYEKLVNALDVMLDVQITMLQTDKISNRLASLQTRILLECQDLIQAYYQLHTLYEDPLLRKIG
jgi:hypothetical protein